MSVRRVSSIPIQGVLDDKNISGLALWNGLAVVVTDEAAKKQGNVAQLFQFQDGALSPLKGGRVVLDKQLNRKKQPEMDLEGVAVDGDTVFVLGSHSAKRPKVDAKKKTYLENRRSLQQAAEEQPSRDVLLSFELDAAGQAGPVQRADLSKILEKEPFKSFRRIASKENGVDAEGLAVYDNHLFVGFRGPVLRENYVPILKVQFSTSIKKHELLFVNLGGLGIRDLAHSSAGLLILAGPVGDGPGDYELFHWDGTDTVPGKDRLTKSSLEPLGVLPLPKGDGMLPKAEGMALERETAKEWTVLIVFDGLPGEVIRYKVKRP